MPLARSFPVRGLRRVSAPLIQSDGCRTSSRWIAMEIQMTHKHILRVFAALEFRRRDGSLVAEFLSMSSRLFRWPSRMYSRSASCALVLV